MMEKGAKPGMIKFIVILRNPTERLISSYIHFRAYNELIVTGRFEEDEDSKLHGGWQGESRPLSEIIANKTREELFLSGEYIVHIKSWFNLMGENNFLVLSYNDLKKDYLSFCNKIFKFVGISELEEIKEYRVNTRTEWEEESSLKFTFKQEEIDKINEYYKPYNQLLFDYLGVDYGCND